MTNIPDLYFKIAIGVIFIAYLIGMFWLIWRLGKEDKSEGGAGDATTRAVLGNFGTFF